MMIMASDTFNENSPPSNDPAYITTLGASVYAAMSKANKNAIWLMQVSSIFLFFRFHFFLCCTLSMYQSPIYNIVTQASTHAIYK